MLPVAGGTLGRTDEGVDISGSPGAALTNPVPGTSQFVGQAPWGGAAGNQPYALFKVISGPFKNAYWYVAEQINIRLKPGTDVTQGQQIGTYAQSGTATEWGWGTSTLKLTKAASLGQYPVDGTVTPAGKSFLSQIINAKGGKAKPTASGPSFVNVPNYVPKQYIPWVQKAAAQTGLPASVVAAQIQAESNFQPGVTSSAGAQGIAQIEPSTWSHLHIKGTPYNVNDALLGYIKIMSGNLKQYNGNIRDALAAYNAGSANIQAGYGYADGILAAAGLPQSAKAGAKNSKPIVRPGGGAAGVTGTTNASGGNQKGVSDVFTQYEQEITLPRTAPPGTRNPFQWWWASFSGQWPPGGSSAPTS